MIGPAVKSNEKMAINASVERGILYDQCRLPVRESDLRLPHSHHRGEQCRFIILDIFHVRDFGHT